jgi:hypothetical protein
VNIVEPVAALGDAFLHALANVRSDTRESPEEPFSVTQCFYVPPWIANGAHFSDGRAATQDDTSRESKCTHEISPGPP